LCLDEKCAGHCGNQSAKVAKGHKVM
ncbi:hypothetical protein CCACVL1_25455, partial [Corchorus capsularis]